MAIFLYTFYDKIYISVEEKRGVAVFLYSFLWKMDESVEENEGVVIFLPFFFEKSVFGVEENEGVAIFLPFFDETVIFGVEENEGVAIFLPFFDENVIFAVEENEGVAVFLYTFAQNHQRTTKKRSWPAASDLKQSGVGRRPTIETKQWRPSRGASLWNDQRKEVGLGPTSALFVFHMEGQPAAAPPLSLAIGEDFRLINGWGVIKELDCSLQWKDIVVE